MDFYDAIAGDYGTIVDAAGRAAGIEAFIGALMDSHPIRSALDVACGAGAYTIALAKRGVRVTGADVSEAMLAGARAAADSADVRIDWVCAPMQTIARRAAGPFDAVLCMGNSIPHVLDDAGLAQTIAGFHQVLAPGGVAVIHLLNYQRILARQERIVGVTRRGDSEYVRFYDFLDGRVRFNVLQMQWDGERCTHELHSTELRPYLADELAAALSEGGFADVSVHGDQQFGPFDAAESDVLMLVAHK
ncbi:hypothetical protein LCGC14_0162550 [marine sediment metagenome]|uniref:Methyltransferase domain-containing protein n=1 Tax=marine sediment metagenome TaxID=412755 RepID=A0A0F9UZ28_9ZZZZ|nr:class I SAM-dependent methyltransferase [Phycisphaerae bacterium]HDZ44268.1 class I SAM-dependent methyltransferase [Phycisphaerae bacterium]